MNKQLFQIMTQLSLVAEELIDNSDIASHQWNDDDVEEILHEIRAALLNALEEK